GQSDVCPDEKPNRIQAKFYVWVFPPNIESPTGLCVMAGIWALSDGRFSGSQFSHCLEFKVSVATLPAP
ncbi:MULTISPECIES: hypothetical protein, partial [unclassified Pseudomonas]|uniref:hypothetical protein n=1 Tax=unclassified Pseudomonas TaxID=196821 RepID=UPI001C49C778